MSISGKFWRSESGSPSVLFALSAIPLIILAGGAVDFAKHARYNTAIQSTLDIAALAAARNLANQVSEGGLESADHSVAEEHARTLFDQSIRPLGIRPGLSFAFDGTRVMAAAEWEMPTAFLPLIGMQALPINRVSDDRS